MKDVGSKRPAATLQQVRTHSRHPESTRAIRKLLPLWISIPLVWLPTGIVMGIHAPLLRLWISWRSSTIILCVAVALLVAILLLLNLAIFHGRARVAQPSEGSRHRSAPNSSAADSASH
jgi:hypothetical protein